MSGEEQPKRRVSLPRQELRLLTAALVAAGVLVLAFRGGAADVVVRQEMAIALVWGMALMFAFGLLPRAHPGVDGWRILASGAALTLLTGLSLLWGESSELGLVEFNRVAFYVAVLSLLLVGVSTVTWSAAAAGLAISMLLLPVAAILSRLTPETFDALGIDVFETRRLLYPLGYWNAVGAWGAMALAVGVSYSAHLRAGPWRRLSLAATPAAGSVIYLSYSRSATVAALLGLAVVVIAARHRGTAAIHALAAVCGSIAVAFAIRSQPEIADATGTRGAEFVGLVLLGVSGACAFVASRTVGRGWGRARWAARKTGAIALAATAVAVVVALALGGAGAASKAGEESAAEYTSARSDPAARLTNLESGRYEIWGSALRAFGSAPILGIGAGGFEFWWNADDEENESLQNAHSLYLEMAAELGLPGLAIVLLLVAVMMSACVKARSRAESASDSGALASLMAVFVIFALTAAVDWVWELPALTAVGLAAAAIAASSGSAPRRPRRTMTRSRFVAAGVAVIAGVAQIPGTVGAQRVRASGEKILIGDLEGGIEDADEAVSAEPWAASPYAQRALSRAAAGDLVEAARDAHLAIEREPSNWRHYALLAQVNALRGKIEPAVTALDRAEGLSPLNSEVFDEIEQDLRTLAAGALSQEMN